MESKLTVQAATRKPSTLAVAVPSRVSNRPANLHGQVFVVEYHHVKSGKTTMHRAPARFRQDLQALYTAGFRPILASEYLSNSFSLGGGATPVVMTFDDSNPSQFALREDGTVDPDCAVGIWQEFAKTHPDFPVRGTFYVLPKVMWKQPRFVARKLMILHKLGSEVGNHTVTHPILRKLPDDKVKQEIGGAALALDALGVHGPLSLAFPFGSSPKNMDIFPSFDYQGKKISTIGAFLVGAGPAPAPGDVAERRYRVPRIQAYDGPLGLDDWMKQLKAGKVKLYVTP